MNKQEQLNKKLLDFGVDTDQIHKLFGNGETLKLVSKVESKVNWFSEKDLKTVSKDLDEAKDLILIILSNFTNTWAVSQSHNNVRKSEGYKRLDSQILMGQVCSRKSAKYKVILNLLEKYAIIEKTANYFVGEKCNEYGLTESYFGRGTAMYTLKTNVAQELNSKFLNAQIRKATSTVLGRNSIKMYSKIQLPTIDEVTEILKKAVKAKYINKKGKRIVNRGKNPNRYSPKDFVFAEDYLKMFKDLTIQYMVPIVTGENAGARVIDSLNMMPSLIRQHITLDGEKLVENDYSALHPNIAMTVYRGSGKQITHEGVAEYLGLSRKEAKIEHLSFFNKRWENLYHSPLFAYYTKNESDMMQNMYTDKARRGYKVTSRRMFDVETQMMSLAVDRLDKEGIDVIYIFDCLFSKESDSTRVGEVMNKVAEEFKVLTTV
jgi:hypothetical protein